MASKTLQVRVVSPERTLFEGEAVAVVVPAWDGRAGILPDHAPYMTLLAGGDLAIDLAGGGSRDYHVVGGLLQVEGHRVTVLAEKASERPLSGYDHIPSWEALDPLERPEGVTPGTPLV